MNNKIVRFLLNERSKNWSFNYWVKDSKEYEAMPYPDDLDDTFCALSGLFLAENSLIKGNIFAKIANLLTNLEVKEGGPYYTWLVPKNAGKSWKDIDLAVNANIAYFLSLEEIILPNLTKLMEEAVKKGKFSSPYYASEYPVIYFISRSFKGNSEKLIDYLAKKKKNGYWNNPLDTSLAISSLLNLNYPAKKLEKSISYLLKNSSFKPYPLIIESNHNGRKIFGGSPALTASFFLEALLKYQKLTNVEKKESEESENLKNRIFSEAAKKFQSLEPALKKIALKTLNEIKSHELGDQIALLPYFFSQTLGNKQKIQKKLLIDLGLINLYGWIAYTIYDDFFDDEGKPKELSLANICLRELTVISISLPVENKDFMPVFKGIMDKIDFANLWEVENCRTHLKEGVLTLPKRLPNYKDYSILAEKSLGHGLGPLAILLSLGYGKNSKEVKNTSKWLKNYIIARQINDDMHDWEKDLKKGHLNSASVPLIKEWMKSNNKRIICLDKDLFSLQKIFWEKTVSKMCETVLKHIKISKDSLKKIPLIEDDAGLTQFFIPIEKAAKEALKEQEDTAQFLKNF